MQNDNKLIIVCSKNKAKNEAVKNVMMQGLNYFLILTSYNKRCY